ncbi:MAG: CDP-alcohol phosphatidyltransferase family protein [Candidatus Marinimicrobia bacterium]|nr:CDP-alcohol phosphatidyltransferase family protein [Candidatus Neomarinimicrobiota bacterium]
MVHSPDRIFTISNGLSLFRAFLSLPLVMALERDLMVESFILVVLAIFSDFADGYLARRSGDITDVGKLLDPIADKFIMMAVMIYLIFDPERHFPVYFFILLGLRDITISILVTYLMNIRKEVFQSNYTGKMFVAFTAAAMTLYIFKFTEAGFYVLTIATGLMFISWFFYLKRYSGYLTDLAAAR